MYGQVKFKTVGGMLLNTKYGLKNKHGERLEMWSRNVLC